MNSVQRVNMLKRPTGPDGKAREGRDKRVVRLGNRHPVEEAAKQFRATDGAGKMSELAGDKLISIAPVLGGGTGGDRSRLRICGSHLSFFSIRPWCLRRHQATIERKRLVDSGCSVRESAMVHGFTVVPHTRIFSALLRAWFSQSQIAAEYSESVGRPAEPPCSRSAKPGRGTSPERTVRPPRSPLR